MMTNILAAGSDCWSTSYTSPLARSSS